MYESCGLSTRICKILRRFVETNAIKNIYKIKRNENQINRRRLTLETKYCLTKKKKISIFIIMTIANEKKIRISFPTSAIAFTKKMVKKKYSAFLS